MILTEKEIYEEFKIAYPKSKLTFEGYYKIVKRIIIEIFKEILYERKVFIFPFCKMGFISVVKSTHKLRHRACNILKGGGYLSPDKLKFLARLEAIHGPGNYHYHTKWDKRSGYCKINRMTYYSFKWSKWLEGRIKSHIKKTRNDPWVETLDAPLTRV